MKKEQNNFVTKSLRFPKDANAEAMEWAGKLGIPFNTYVVLALRHLNEAHREKNKLQKKSSVSLGFDTGIQDEIMKNLVD